MLSTTSGSNESSREHNGRDAEECNTRRGKSWHLTHLCEKVRLKTRNNMLSDNIKTVSVRYVFAVASG
jgi:hypothetical protein